MATDTASPLRQRMIEDMNSRNLGAGTQRGHIRSCKRFAAFLKRSPDTTTIEDIRLFQLHLAETGVSICTRNRIRVPRPPRFPALALFRRRPQERVHSLAMPASENLHKSCRHPGLTQ